MHVPSAILLCCVVTVPMTDPLAILMTNSHSALLQSL